MARRDGAARWNWISARVLSFVVTSSRRDARHDADVGDVGVDVGDVGADCRREVRGGAGAVRRRAVCWIWIHHLATCAGTVCRGSVMLARRPALIGLVGHGGRRGAIHLFAADLLEIV
jgi:hypothetical protein